MSDNHDYLGTGNKSRLTADATFLMLKGAGYAMMFCLVIWVSLVALQGIGLLLPEESRETEDPTPFSHLLSDPAINQLT
ncbi:RC-LH1 core complex protein PufX [Planktotalea sp.]|uniref:RC-LH1 core complex protein PufX n=1 Tax=Planktotalea sp. TaxID=2029877 RepID=UPI0025F8ACB9|nr:RC-LH1 core complex protein PufX [Planktotalea sp.]